MESKLAGISFRTATLTIDSNVPAEDRYIISPIQGESDDEGDWFSSFIERPVILSSEISSTFDGLVVIPFPDQFKVPSDWQGQERSKLRLYINPTEDQTPIDVALDW